MPNTSLDSLGRQLRSNRTESIGLAALANVTMPTTKNSAKALVGSFKELGLSATQVRHFVPKWWDDEAATDEGGLLELQIVLARRLNVALGSLQSAAPKPEFRAGTRRFKTIHPEGSAQLAVAAGVGHGLAHVLAGACKTEAPKERLSSTDLRVRILRKYPAVTLEGLCRWLWEHGIPVVHILNWPRQLRRPDAMCVRVGARPVVLVVRKEVAPARLAYLVAHEAGHLMSGHLTASNNAVLVDDTLPVDDQGFAKDEDEKVADAYAMELLGGDALRAACREVGRQDGDVKLAVAALKACKDTGLDAGQVLLGWARLTENWKLSGMAMRYLMTAQAAPIVVNDVARDYIDQNALSADGLDHLNQLTSIQFHDE